MSDLQLDPKVKRHPVDYRNDSINPLFLRFLAKIAAYAGNKYGDPLQYLGARLKGEKGPINHAREHIGAFQLGETHDQFGDDPRWQLAAAAYNLMMEFVYITAGHEPDAWPDVLLDAALKHAAASAERLTPFSELQSLVGEVKPTAFRKGNQNINPLMLAADSLSEALAEERRRQAEIDKSSTCVSAAIEKKLKRGRK